MMPVAHTTRLPPPAPTPRMLPRSLAPVGTTMRFAARAAHAAHVAQAERPTCLNCAEVLAGKFCHSCGQSAKTPKRITVGAILHELPHAVLHLEHALPHTILALLRRPGHTIRDYLGGKRAKVYSPFTLLFLVSGLLGLALVALRSKNMVPAGAPSANELGPRITTALFKHQAWVRLAFLPLIAVGPTLVLRGRTGLRYGEQIVAAAMLTAGSAMVKLAFVPLQYLGYRWSVSLGGALASAAEVATTLYALWTYAQLQNDGKRRDPILRWLRSLASLAVSTVAWLLGCITLGVLVIAGVELVKRLHG
ncbi:MAG: DUF3667 domain-containing protein [Labilithrix sp.]